MNNTEKLGAINYLLRNDELMRELWYKLQLAFPSLDLNDFAFFNLQDRLPINGYKAATNRWAKLELRELTEQFSNLTLEPIADKLRRHPKLFKAQLGDIDLDNIVDRIKGLRIMLSKCTAYTSAIDPSHESGVWGLIGTDLDDLTYTLEDFSAMVFVLQQLIVGQPVKETETTPEEPVFKTFADIFIKHEHIEPCINALLIIRPDAPIISDTRNWQKREGSKAVLAAWIRRMEDCGKIYFIADKRKLVPLLNTFFPNLNLGLEARTLKEPDSDIVREFAALILP